ncbi:MAG: RagB/SusD family nutrient uptake outer membrane protein [Bacteroidales bacterium]|nr:RagB/SusD family nutrient uptake outer membrane protein [Bacteroidales bacterium]
MKKIINILGAATIALGMASCSGALDVKNPNNQTTYDFGNSESDLKEAIISCYNRIRLEGTFARVGYTMDAVRGDEVYNPGQVWYLPYDNLNVANTDEIGCQWIWRDCFHVVNRCNYVLLKVETAVKPGSEAYNQIKGQALFLRSLAYYELATYYQRVPLFTDYSQYSSLETMFSANVEQDEVFDLIDADLAEAMTLLPSRDKGGEWATGRATCGAAAGYLARSYMFRHKYAEALDVLTDIIDGKYGHYELMPDYGMNFKEGVEFENNSESLFEVQFMDYGKGGTDDEWTPVNISRNASQGHAVESNCGPAANGSWGDLAASPWLYNLFKAERCTDGTLDPRLYWTIASYESEYNSYTGAKTAAYPKGDPRCNVIYTEEISASPVTNAANGGLVIAKNTNARNNIYKDIVTGLKCGVNLRLMRYSDVLLRAAECENELHGPSDLALGWINEVRRRVALPDLKSSDFTTADALFEQIANVERPKEFGCENGRGIDLIRWGFFYNQERLDQISQHSAYLLQPEASSEELTVDTAKDYSYKYFKPGHEYFPIFQGTLNANPKLTGNSANDNHDNAEEFLAKWNVHPVVK